jgi:hypothetical protein
LCFIEEPSSTEAAGKQTATNALGSEAAPQSRTAETPAAAVKKVAKTVATTATPSPTTDAASARPKPIPAAGATKVAKAAAVVKSLQSTMVEDVIPELSTFLKKQDGISDVELTFVDNEVFCLAEIQTTNIKTSAILAFPNFDFT